MSFPRHWSLRYFWDKGLASSYAQWHRDAPWLTRHAVRRLDAWLKPSMRGFEWGAGRSTLWLAKRLAHLTSVEHAPEWYARVSELLQHNAIGNVDLSLASPSLDTYTAAIAGVVENSLDFVLVDGVSALRGQCALAALLRVRPGGMLVVDDAQRYLPHPHAHRKRSVFIPGLHRLIGKPLLRQCRRGHLNGLATV